MITDAAPSSSYNNTSPDISGDMSPPNTTVTPTTSPPNPPALLNEVIVGVKVLQRRMVSDTLVSAHLCLHQCITWYTQTNTCDACPSLYFPTTQKIHLAELGSLYQVDSATQESGLHAFSILSQSLMTIDLLEQNDIASDSLSIYKLVIKGILDDACHWVSG